MGSTERVMNLPLFNKVQCNRQRGSDATFKEITLKDPAGPKLPLTTVRCIGQEVLFRLNLNVTLSQLCLMGFNGFILFPRLLNVVLLFIL